MSHLPGWPHPSPPSNSCILPRLPSAQKFMYENLALDGSGNENCTSGQAVAMAASLLSHNSPEAMVITSMDKRIVSIL